MNMHVTVPNERAAHPVPAPPRRVKDSPRALILDQVVAGILWMSLDLPEDTSREELEALAHQLVARIRAGSAESAIETELTLLHSERFCRHADASIIRCLVRRAANIVSGSRGTPDE
jgi:hypothetical protein